MRLMSISALGRRLVVALEPAWIARDRPVCQRCRVAPPHQNVVLCWEAHAVVFANVMLMR